MMLLSPKDHTSGPVLPESLNIVSSFPGVTYIRHTPSPPLNLYVDYLYYLDGAMPHPREEILPFPALDLKINLGNAFKVYKAHSPNHLETYSDCWWVGLFTEHHILGWPAELKVFGARIKPDGAYPLLQLPLSELCNRVVPSEAIWGPLAAEIRERLCATPSVQAGFVLLEQLLAAQLSEEPYGLDVVHYAIKEIGQRKGNLSIRALSDRIGISQNHLSTRFKQMVGTTPKILARLYRFKHTLRLIDSTEAVDWTQIGHQAGYYDQSHLTNDFKAFLGRSPGDYLRLRQRAYAERPDHIRFLRDLPID